MLELLLKHCNELIIEEDSVSHPVSLRIGEPGKLCDLNVKKLGYKLAFNIP